MGGGARRNHWYRPFGALVSYPIANFLLGKPLALLTLITSFSMSSVAGACIGFIVLQILSRRHLLHKEA